MIGPAICSECVSSQRKKNTLSAVSAGGQRGEERTEFGSPQLGGFSLATSSLLALSFLFSSDLIQATHRGTVKH